MFHAAKLGSLSKRRRKTRQLTMNNDLSEQNLVYMRLSICFRLAVAHGGTWTQGREVEGVNIVEKAPGATDTSSILHVTRCTAPD